MKKKKPPKVYILGDARGFYRIQNTIKFFLDRPKEYRCSFNNYWSNKRPIKYFKSLFINGWHVLFSNIVYVSILNVDADILFEMFLAFIFRKKIVVDYYISIYEKVVVDEGWFKEGSFLAKLAKKLDQFYFDVATKVIFLSDFEKERYCQFIDRSPEHKKCVAIPHCIDESFTISENQDTTFNICWWGSYLPLHGLNIIMEAAKLLKDDNLNLKWYFFGNSDEKAIPYVEKAKELEIEADCVFENSFTMKNGKLIEFLKHHCDLCLGNFGTSTKARSLMSNKVLDACAMKALVLSGNAKAYYGFFDGETDILLCECNAEDIADRVRKVYKMSKDERIKQIEQAYDIFQNQFTITKYNERFAEVLNSLYEEK